MRIRKKAWAQPELLACPYFVWKPEENKGKWNTVFKNQGPIHLDLGCGKGVFLAEAAYRQQDINLIGIDISMDILGVARRNIEQKFEKEPENIRFFLHNIEKITELFSEKDNIERIYINFCNPWPKARAHKRRLTHPIQLAKYKEILVPGGEIWFKTDNDDLYLATLRYFEEAGLEIIYRTTDLHKDKNAENLFTEHEGMFTAQGIKTKAIRGKWRCI